MHKLKNKHTGEVITTPYLAEVEEYLNSGDYEMSKPMLKIAQNGAIVYESEDLTLNVNGLFFVEHETNTLYAGEQAEMLLYSQQKPVYTKEMQERGEYPKIGSEVLVRYNFDSKTVTHAGKVLYVSQRHIILEIEGLDYHYKLGDYIIEPLPTIKGELIKFLRETPHLNPEAMAHKMLELYNITPK